MELSNHQSVDLHFQMNFKDMDCLDDLFKSGVSQFHQDGVNGF